MTDMTLARIRELNKSRTQGGWWWGADLEGRGHVEVTMYSAPEDEPIFWDAKFPDDDSPHGYYSSVGNMEFIAAAPAMIEYLLNLVDDLERTRIGETLVIGTAQGEEIQKTVTCVLCGQPGLIPSSTQKEAGDD